MAPLNYCIRCIDTSKNPIPPWPNGPLTVNSFKRLGYCGCSLDYHPNRPSDGNRLSNADRFPDCGYFPT